MITLQNTMFYKGGRYRSLLISAAISALAAFAAAPFAAAESSYPLEGGTRTFVETGDGFDVVNTTENSKPGGRGGSGVVIVAYDILQSGFMIILR